MESYKESGGWKIVSETWRRYKKRRIEMMTKISTNPKKERDSQDYKSLKSLIKMVPEVGIEPTRTRGPGDFESPASTNFTTPAVKNYILTLHFMSRKIQ